MTSNIPCRLVVTWLSLLPLNPHFFIFLTYMRGHFMQAASFSLAIVVVSPRLMFPLSANSLTISLVLAGLRYVKLIFAFACLDALFYKIFNFPFIDLLLVINKKLKMVLFKATIQSIKLLFKCPHFKRCCCYYTFYSDTQKLSSVYNKLQALILKKRL